VDVLGVLQDGAPGVVALVVIPALTRVIIVFGRCTAPSRTTCRQSSAVFRPPSEVFGRRGDAGPTRTMIAVHYLARISMILVVTPG
jgi:hypothetical protein